MPVNDIPDYQWMVLPMDGVKYNKYRIQFTSKSLVKA